MRYIILFLVCFLGLPVQAQQYGQIDSRAKTAPIFETEAELVSYLTQGLTDSKAKARAIAVWIAYQVQRDGYRYKELIKYSNKNRPAPEPLQNNVFKTRVGTSQEFASLFASLAGIAGLETQTIAGYAGKNIRNFRYQKPAYQAAEVLAEQWGVENYSLQRYQASWNAVKIDNTWQLIDTYWMIANDDLFVARNITSETAMERFLKQREQRSPNRSMLAQSKRIDDAYFCAKPRFFIKTHFPLDSQWQLLPTPLTWSSFTSR